MKLKYVLLCFCIVFSNALFAGPDIKRWVTKDGVDALFIAAPELPMIDIAVTFDAGTDRDGDLAGLSQLMHSLMNSGTGDLDADAIAESFENVGAQFSSSASLDRSTVTLRSLTDEKLFKQALTTYVNVLTNPSFPEKDFKRLKNQALIAIKDSEQRPGNIASRAFYKAIYADHPYSQPSLGYKKTIENITLENVTDFHSEFIVKQNALITMVGDIDFKQAKKIANEISSKLSDGKKPDPIKIPVPRKNVEDIYIPYPSQQAHVFLGQLGIQRGHPNYFKLYTGNHVLGGGGFTSRLVKNVRVERGLSYSVYSYFYPLHTKGPFVLGLQTRTDQAEQAAEVSMQTIETFLKEGPTDEELTLSKNNIIGGFPLRVDNNRDKLGYLSLIGYYKLPLDYLDTFTSNIEEVTKEDIVQAFQQQLKLDNMIKIIVGGPEN